MTTFTLHDQGARATIVHQHDENLFVDAGAGSGKTKQLVDRVVRLVASDSSRLTSIGNLAAITFTENAAMELRTRIREALEDAAADTLLPEDERTRCRQALGELDDAAITTLHGFAARLLTDAPLEAGLPPGFRVQDAVRASIDRDVWWRSLLDDWYDDPTLARTWEVGLTLGLNPSYLKEVVGVFDSNWDLLINRPVPPMPLPALDASPILDPLQSLVSYAAGTAPTGDRLTLLIEDVLVPLLREASAETDPLQVLAVVRDARIGGSPGNANAWRQAGLDKTVAISYLTAARQARDDQLTRCREAVTATLAERLRTAVLAHAAARRARGELWFHDLLVFARELLREDEQVRDVVRQRWQVICIDEFQDTDPLQVDLVHLIAGVDGSEWHSGEVDGGRLFFVGDPKQSIYRFRRAEVQLFAAVRDHYADGRLGLSQNFRSRPTLLSVVNGAFTPLLGNDQVIGYEPLQPARPHVHGDPGPDVLLLGGPATDPIAQVRQVEAAHVAATLHRARGSWLVRDEETKLERAARYGDMAILVPTRTSLSQLEDALDQRAIPYRIMSRSLIWESDAVRDLITVLQAIDDPADSVAVVAALRHSMFASSDDDLVAWRAAGGSWSFTAPPPEGLATTPVGAAMAALATYHALRWWLPVNVLLDRIIRERRAVELTAAHSRPRDHWRRLRFVVDQARLFLDSGGAGVTAFIRWAQEQIDSAADAIETVTPERDDDAVQILTIHGSKGLEFPLVALTGINNQPNGAAHVMWPADGPAEIDLYKGFRTSGFRDAQAHDKDADAAENLRLLYVAMTRASDHLVVSLHHSASANPPAEPNSHAMRLWRMLIDLASQGAVHEPAAAEPAAEAASTAEARVVADISERANFLTARSAQLTAARRKLPTTATGLVEAAEHDQDAQEPSDPLADSPISSAADEIVRARPVALSGATLGSAVHRTLELLPFDAINDTTIQRAADTACIEAGAIHLVSEVTRRVRAAARSPLLTQAAQCRRWKEVSIVVDIDGRVVEGLIDLLIETPEGLLVVDYKTDAVRDDAELQGKVLHYTPQLNAYARAVAGATGAEVAGMRLLFCGRDTATMIDVPRQALPSPG